jgi:Na+/proline symporter
MSIVIGVAYYAVVAAGGMQPMMAKIETLRAANGGSDPFAFFPDFSRGITTEAIWTVPVLTFLVFLCVQWWAFWYPGAEPGGGGYIAQRIFSARDERHGLLSVLWFNVAHYALRPWPWIITGLAAIVLYPGLEHPETSYMAIVNDHVPHALRGIILAGFLAAFMSTVATQLNWGASYLVSDFYRRFVKKNATEGHYVVVSRLVTVLLVIAAGYISAQLASIRSGWEFVLELGAGTGAVYLLRWYWWRINAWSEISAMATALVTALVLHKWAPYTGNQPVIFAKTALTTTLATTIIWLVVTLVTGPEPDEMLEKFYRKVRPDVRGWKPVAARTLDIKPNRDLGTNLVAWILGCAMVYLALFGAGKVIFREPLLGVLLLVGSVVCAFLLYREQSKRGWGAEKI